MTIRPNRSDPDSVRDATWAVHGGNAPDPGTGALRTPLVMANSYVLPEDPSTIDWSDTEGLVYTRNGGVNQIALERKLAVISAESSSLRIAIRLSPPPPPASRTADGLPTKSVARHSARVWLCI